MPDPPLPPAVLISALSMACASSRGLLVKSCSRSTFTSNESRKASSCLRRTCSRNWLPACCSRGSTRCWLPEVSSRMPRVSGWLVSATKLLSVCGALSSSTEQFCWFRCGTRLPLLSLTVKNRSTRFTVCLKVATGVSSGGGAGALLTGDASGEGASWPHPAAVRTGRPTKRAAIPIREMHAGPLDENGTPKKAYRDWYSGSSGRQPARLCCV